MEHLRVRVRVVCKDLYLLALFQAEEKCLWCFGDCESTTEECINLEERRSIWTTVCCLESWFGSIPRDRGCLIHDTAQVRCW